MRNGPVEEKKRKKVLPPFLNNRLFRIKSSFQKDVFFVFSMKKW